MYNRYVPQSDGSYRRNAIPDPPTQPPPAPIEEKKQEDFHKRERPINQVNKQLGVGSFFKQILPNDFDTADLIVVLLLLLMAADCQEEQNSALLTLALYLFL